MNRTWSYSRLTSYHQCPYQFYLKYAEEREGENNAWAIVGGFVHEILESIGKGEITLEEARDFYAHYYPDVEFPSGGYMSGYGEKIHSKLSDFFFSLEGLGEVISVEREFTLDLPNGDKLTGFIDLETRDDGIIVTDYKISNPFKKKDIEEKEKQLYVYAMAVYQHYGEYPKAMQWWHLKEDKKVLIEFDESKIDDTMEWIVGTIDMIDADDQFEAIPDYFFCSNLCDFRNSCEYKNIKND